MAKVKVTILEPFGSYTQGEAMIEENRLPYLLENKLVSTDVSSQENAPTESKSFEEVLREKFSKEIVDELQAAGYQTAEDIKDATDQDLNDVKGVGEATAKKLRTAAEEFKG